MDLRKRGVAGRGLAQKGRQAKAVAVLVLGDIGHSPRMQYHALSLARAGHCVELVGYEGSKPMEQILDSPNITIRHIRSLPRPTSASRVVFYLYAPIKIVCQVFMLLWLLLVTMPRLDYMVVQNPPAIPTLAVARVYAGLTNARLIIDWHNYGYTILGMSLGEGHAVVRLAQWFERAFGKSAYAHLCVTSAMARDLRDSWKVRGKLVVLHDKAPKHFRRLNTAEIHQLWRRMASDSKIQWPLSWHVNEEDVGNAGTLLTQQRIDGTIEMRKDRPMLIVSTTSWTADEDFSILLDALARYDSVASHLDENDMDAKKQLPRLAVLITGKGPLRAYYEQAVARMKLRRVHIATAWLSAEDYPLVLGSADIGVSLHTSSSGLDLPMKIVDMLGCGTPVCAYSFSCIGELVTADNGLVFGNAEELAQQIEGLARQLDCGHSMYERLLQGAARFREIDWDTNYGIMLDLLQ
ncbi:mannosyltransferase [Coemansia sp. RSA 2399]|nr:mannosyltransferase [Coemansia sp. RSA 2399]